MNSFVEIFVSSELISNIYLRRWGSPPQLRRLHPQSGGSTAAAASSQLRGSSRSRGLFVSLFLRLEDGRRLDHYRGTRGPAGQLRMRVLPVYPVSPGRARLLSGQQRMRVLFGQVRRLGYRQQVGRRRRHRQQIRLIDQHGVRRWRYTRLLEAPRRLG